MEYYESIRNKFDCVCRPWPLLPSSQADDEIARLRAHVSQLREDNRGLRSQVKSLMLANEELQAVVRAAVRR